MSRSLFLLLTGLYGALLTVAMVCAPESALKNYGAPSVDLTHMSVMQFLGLSMGALALLTLLNRNAPHSFSLRSLLLAQAFDILGGVVLGIYHRYVLQVPHSAFFVGDTLFRLVLGLGFVYFYNHETQQACLGKTVA